MQFPCQLTLVEMSCSDNLNQQALNVLVLILFLIFFFFFPTRDHFDGCSAFRRLFGIYFANKTDTPCLGFTSLGSSVPWSIHQILTSPFLEISNTMLT